MGLKVTLNNKNTPIVKRQNVVPGKNTSVSTINKNRKKHKNLKQIFILSVDALRERKARSALTILMVVVGSALMVALNGLSAGAADFISKQLNFLAPNVIFVSPGQIGFRGGPSEPPAIVFNAEVVNRIKSLPFVQDVVPAYQGQLQLDAQGSIINSQVLSTDPTKIYLIAPSMQLILHNSYIAVFDIVGGDTYKRSFKVLKKGSGMITSMLEQPNSELMNRYGVKAFVQFTQANRQLLTKLGEWVDQNNIKVNIAKTFSIDEAADALDYQKDVHPRGKVVITV